jgi:hypothetical protein
MTEDEQTPGEHVEASTAVILAAYKRLLTYQFGGSLLLVLILGLALIFAKQIGAPPLMLLIMLSGMLGAFFSALTRLYNVDSAAAAVISPTVSKLGQLHLLIYSLVPPVIGAIAALVLYLGFAGDILQGGVFPKIVCRQEGACNTIYGIVINFVPGTPSDYARALLWSFIAGFSERFVPDTLLTVVARQREQQAGG